MRRVSDRLPSPGPSYRACGPGARCDGPARPSRMARWSGSGMAKPSIMDDGWWLTSLWVEDDEGVIEAADAAPAAGPAAGCAALDDRPGPRRGAGRACSPRRAAASSSACACRRPTTRLDRGSGR